MNPRRFKGRRPLPPRSGRGRSAFLARSLSGRSPPGVAPRAVRPSEATVHALNGHTGQGSGAQAAHSAVGGARTARGETSHDCRPRARKGERWPGGGLFWPPKKGACGGIGQVQGSGTQGDSRNPPKGPVRGFCRHPEKRARARACARGGVRFCPDGAAFPRLPGGHALRRLSSTPTPPKARRANVAGSGTPCAYQSSPPLA